MRRSIVAVLAGVLVAGSLLTGTGSAQAPLTDLLPSLTQELVLDIARVEAPPAGVGLQIHADFPTDSPLELDGVKIYSLTVDITPEGTLFPRTILTQDHFATEGEGGSEAGECDDPTFLPTGVTWKADSMPILWRLNRRSTPDEINKVKTLLTARAAHRVWPQAQTNCTDRARYSFAYNYLGPTGKHPKYDGSNIVDFGALGQGALAVNSTWYTSSNEIVEVDLRLNKEDYPWTNMPGSKRYQVMNVIAHELGHQVGLDDLGSPHRGLTMFGQIGKGEMNKVTLGRGDLRGADAIAP